MENQDYLNQISGDVRPAKPEKTSFLSSKYLKWGLGFVAGLVLVMIAGSLLGSASGGVKKDGIWLKLRIDNALEAISEYQNIVKSSNLRSSSASLYGVLSNTSRDLTTYLTEKYEYSEKSTPKDLTEEMTLEKDGLLAELFEAKINGNLDRIYAHKMAYEITMITSKEADLIDATSDKDLKALLETSYDSLATLYEKFNDFSETK
ncbi:MAG: hypothetical protein Q4B65_02095 [Candidatus Saccharibacteria bacterium]|nr:hypothetical protein [Candidatus Saccharibacteria bacterium]